MLSDHASHIRALLRSGQGVEIGGPSAPRPKRAASRVPSRTQVILGFAAIYLIWGSTYLGIRYAVETIPPLLMMGVRHLSAGSLVYAWARRRGTPAPSLRQWGYALIAGALLFLGGHGSLAWAEQKVPSGLAALLCATLPLWTVLLGRLRGSEHHLGGRAWLGLALGFVGVVVLIGPGALRQDGTLDLLAAGAVLLSAFMWSVGTIYSHGVSMPKSTILSAAMQMMTGGAWLLLSGVSVGETAQFHMASLTAKSILALAYLTVFGSIVAFTAFTWLLTVCSPSRVSTYAYVNPVVAVFIGWAVAGEAIGAHTLAATVIILASVALVTTRRKQPVAEEAGDISLDGLQEAVGD
jgi:drug/metabolite transporter (DMT)-like permease